MTSSTETVGNLESRRDVRAPVLATALVSQRGQAKGPYNVVNLSAGGALLSGRLDLPVGSIVDLTLRLPWTPAIRTEAAIVAPGASEREGVFALSFLSLSPRDADVIHSAVVHLLRTVRSARVLVVTAQSVEICHSFALAIEDLGCPAVVVTTASEAIKLLEGTNAFKAVIFDELLRRDGAPDFLAFAARSHPKIRRVLLLAARSDEAPCVQLGVHAVLARPCTDAALAAALALAPSRKAARQPTG